MNTRHYIHGDQLENDHSLFYCLACDAFLQREHFLEKENKCCDHWQKFDEAMRKLGTTEENHRKFGRPIGSPNIFNM